MAKKLPYYPMYPSDFDTDENARRLNDTEAGFFLRCLNHAWNNHGSIPAEITELASCLSRRVSYCVRLWKKVSRCFVPHPDDPTRLVNPRQWKEFCAAQRKSEVSSSCGKLGAESRWNDGDRHSHPIDSPSTHASVLVSDSVSETTNDVREDEEKKLMREGLVGYVRRLDGSSFFPPPDDGIVEQCLRAGSGATAAEIIQVLKFLHQNGQSPGESAGPKRWAWFPAVIARRFSKSKGQVA